MAFYATVTFHLCYLVQVKLLFLNSIDRNWYRIEDQMRLGLLGRPWSFQFSKVFIELLRESRSVLCSQLNHTVLWKIFFVDFRKFFVFFQSWWIDGLLAWRIWMALFLVFWELVKEESLDVVTDVPTTASSLAVAGSAVGLGRQIQKPRSPTLDFVRWLSSLYFIIMILFLIYYFLPYSSHLLLHSLLLLVRLCSNSV